MKKVYFLLLALIMVITISACESRSIGIIGGADGPTKIIVGKKSNEKQYMSEKEPVKAVMIDGYIYYETGEDNDINGRCGNLDGSFTKAVDKWEIPKNDNESNFELKSKNTQGYQLGFTEGTIEVQIGDDWEIFKKFETVQDIFEYKYILKVEGKIEGTKDDVEYIILSNTLNVTANDVATSQLNSADKTFLVVRIDYD